LVGGSDLADGPPSPLWHAFGVMLLFSGIVFATVLFQVIVRNVLTRVSMMQPATRATM